MVSIQLLNPTAIMAKKSIKGTRTEQNIVNAFVAETGAYARYTYYAQAADKEQYFPIGEIFRNTAENELRHAKVFLKMLEDTVVDAGGSVDAGFLGKTADNLRTSIKEEKQEGYEFYLAAAKTATEEGFDDIAAHFEAIASRSVTASGLSCCSSRSRTVRYGSARSPSSGSASYADTFTRASLLPMYALPATTPISTICLST